MNSNIKNLFAFTLAEVLITLGIIGVVAAMTMPVLIQKYQEKITANKLKKFESIMSQAFLMSTTENGTPDEWGLDSSTEITEPVLSNKLVPYLQIIKDCGLKGGCFYNSMIKFMNNSNWANLSIPTGWGQMTFILADGSLVAANVVSSNCSSERGTSKELKNICALVYYDVNGSASPNIFGKDFFTFYLTKYGIIPMGTSNELENMHSFTKDCIGTSPSGMGCAAWVIQNENMDYLHCPDKLSWEGKHSCK